MHDLEIRMFVKELQHLNREYLVCNNPTVKKLILSDILLLISVLPAVI
ncbi:MULTISPECIES: hypothetical protein [Bacillaceae]|nr:MULTISPECIES: hypothetical protein [Bacillaceae]MCE4047956.1 hypothetical protein [Bacillus sp. Au-Bac7]MCM3032487.1 hypothetical protein [Niallia sp. MER 6]MDL0436393.1 hypothetical protein [Niallia sp. SS-2023]UPO89208.1 hypothetical protein L8T27_008715 [Niallia sp. Man26]